MLEAKPVRLQDELDVKARKGSGLTPTQEDVLPSDDIQAFSLPMPYLRPFAPDVSSAHNRHLHFLQSLLTSLLNIP